MEGSVMKHTWTPRRHFVPPALPHRRVDQAYQRLLRWTLPPTGSPPTASRSAPNQEVHDASRFICPGLQPTPGPDPNHRPAVGALTSASRHDAVDRAPGRDL